MSLKEGGWSFTNEKVNTVAKTQRVSLDKTILSPGNIFPINHPMAIRVIRGRMAFINTSNECTSHRLDCIKIMIEFAGR